MPNIDQKNIRIFHILENNNDDELKQFITKNLPILQGYLLVFDNLSDDLKKFLDSNDIDYIKNKHLRLNAKPPTIEIKKEKPNINNDNLDANISKSKIIQKVVRSGENINNKGDIFVFNRVNSASKIISDGSVLIFGECEGDVECNGEFLILAKITKGKILFQGEIITPNMLKYKLNLIIKENGKLNIKDILSL
ncbi:septum site-determining protein MinC [Helicobacter sp. 16-1353]|uniref:septum site-determining protein MinC n=1 Tax=Helicobacter sp. 16-1353 TaxID=2004996 RepID=UPI0015EF81FF|nr:septum site-determining protein MinC [Helicobacter sp. 16-1353]